MSFPFTSFSTAENIESALQFIPSDDRDVCVKIGMAVKSTLGEPGYPVWDQWLQTGNGYNQRDMRAVWKSIKLGPVTIATLFYEAKQCGFQFNKQSLLTPMQVENRQRSQRIAMEKAEQDEIRRQKRNKQRIEKILFELLPSGKPMVQYFLNRGLGRFEIPESIKFHPALDYWNNGIWLGQFPAVVSIVTDKMDKVVTLHLIYLTNDGHKALVPNPKKILPVITTTTGAAVKFAVPDQELYLAEGIETALAVMLATRKTVWSCLTAHGLKTVVIPDFVSVVYIMADKDRSGTGQRVANNLAKRLIEQGITVHILFPVNDIPEGKKSIDWLDIFCMDSEI